MFNKSDIPMLVQAFRKMKNPPELFHACQLVDFATYLDLGGIPSRNWMTVNKKPFTPFESDAKDAKSGHDRLVFLNLTDSGGLFHFGSNVPRGTPNCYGPILIKVSPEALLGAEDVALCLRSISDERGGAIVRNQDSLGPKDELNKMFDEKGFEKRIDELSAAFPAKKSGGGAELSCNFWDEKVSIQHWTSVIVDPLQFDGSSLLQRVQHLLEGKQVAAQARYTKHQALYSEIVQAVAIGKRTVAELRATTGFEKIPSWTDRISHEWMYERFASYLRSGTFAHWEISTTEKIAK